MSDMENMPYRVHPKAGRVMLIIMILSFSISGLGSSLGLSDMALQFISIPGVGCAAILAFSGAKIWQKK